MEYGGKYLEKYLNTLQKYLNTVIKYNVTRIVSKPIVLYLIFR